MIPDVEVKERPAAVARPGDGARPRDALAPGDCLTAETAEFAENSFEKKLCGLRVLCG